MARRKAGLFRLIVKKVRANRKAKRQAAIKQAKANVRNAELIRKQHRTTAGEIKATGEFDWEGAGLPDSTVMEPVMGKNGWEWHPVGKRSYITHNSPKTMGELEDRGFVDQGVRREHDRSQQMVKDSSGRWVPLRAQKCGAPTKDGKTCSRLGNCPIPAHKRHRKGK